ncbi:MAG: hypothetical protein IJW20_01650 [Clostridia bacterium]|nr:hypothetical protein [Clostridia bacterium]
MENNINKSFEFTGKEIAEIEWVLVKAIELFHESPDPSTIKNNVQEYFIRYCCERKYPIKETLEKVNSLLKKGINIKMQDIIPESKRGQESLIRGNLAAILIKSGAIWDEDKTNEMMSTFCEVTGVSKEMTEPIVATIVKQKKREIIEKDLYSFLGKRVAVIEDAKDRKAMGEEIIGAYAEHLKLDPKYIKGVLRDKKKKDEAERKRIEEYIASQAKSKSNPANLDDDEPR